mgnify:CR=1 FL=1
MNTSADLLKELRIDRKAPPPAPPSRRGLWITLAVVVVLLLTLRAAARLVSAEGLIYAESGAPLDEEVAAACGLRIVRAGRAGQVHFHLLQRA